MTVLRVASRSNCYNSFAHCDQTPIITTILFNFVRLVVSQEQRFSREGKLVPGLLALNPDLVPACRS